MKPYLLALLVAIPLLICNILACENSESTEVAPAKTESAVGAGSGSRGATGIPSTSSPSSAKPAPTTRSVPAHAKSWFM